MPFYPRLSSALPVIAILCLVGLPPSSTAQQQVQQPSRQQSPQQQTPPQQIPQQQRPQQQAPQSMQSMNLPSFVNLVKQQGNAVVNVSATRTMSTQPAVPGIEGDPLFEFFRRFGPPPEDGERQAQGLGSGFIISPDGYILTNAHVIADTDDVTVKLTDKREFKAKVVGADTYTDIALLKIEATDLPALRIGKPQNLEPGEWVAAIGAPFGFENSITAGIVSAKGRMLPNESYVPFIQTDVAVNPGNSGGPLFSMRGEVVGINSMIYSRTGGFMGLSFAIPIDIAMDVAQQLRTNGKVTRSRIGVQVQELSRELAQSFGLEQPRGALVAMVEEGGPADKAGMRAGDIVLSLNGQEVESSADLARYVASTKPGTTVTAEVWRKGQRVPIKVTTVEMPPPSSATRQGTGSGGGSEAAARLGLSVVPLADEQRRVLQLDYGILVQDAQGPAASTGIRAGDLILSLDDTQVKSVEHFEQLLTTNAGKTVALLVRRGPNSLFVPLRIPAQQQN